MTRSTVNKADVSINPPNAMLVDGVADGVVAFLSSRRARSVTLSGCRPTKSDFGSKTTRRNSSDKECMERSLRGEIEALSEEKFVSSDTAIPQAKLQNYVNCFHNRLASEVSNTSTDFQRELVGDPNGALTLTLTLKLRVFTSEWSPSYTFLLDPVKLEPVDVLTSKVRDLEEEIIQLRSELDNREGDIGHLRSEVAKLQKSVSSGENMAFITATTKQNTDASQNIIWEKAQPSRHGDFVELLPSGGIKFSKSGVFDIRVSVIHSSTNNGADNVQLWKNGVLVCGCIDSNPNAYHQTSIMNCIQEVAAKDEYTVKYSGNSYAYPKSSLQILALMM